MLIDNEKGEILLHEWIKRHVNRGRMDIVTGYFTVGALGWWAETLNAEIERFRFVVGDIVSTVEDEIQGLDLLNENLSLGTAFELPAAARLVVKFLRQEKVMVKTLEPNFCHAKAFLYKADSSNRQRGDSEDFFITGSSNLTEAGLGMKKTSNVELNMVGHGTEANYDALREWYSRLWSRKEAHEQKTVIGPDGKKHKLPFKEYLIQEIGRLFHEYQPREIYFKILYELFGDRVDGTDLGADFNKLVGRLENTRVYQKLYEFQRKGVLSIIRMLQRYGGAILADAVGLGKTWQALAVMKFFEMEGHEVILLCPKKLDQNWQKYYYRRPSIFQEDRMDFVVRWHTDLQDDRLEKRDRNLSIEDYFRSDKPKLIVIDESHNLRNDKSNRYKFLVENLLKQEAEVKVLLLSATPINNTLLDIRNQFKLLVRGDKYGFDQSLDVRNLDHVFARASNAFKTWQQDPDRTMSRFLNLLPPQLFRLTDALTVARTRKMIAGEHAELHFPNKAAPENVFVTPEYIGNFESFDELFQSFPPRLSAYMPSWYVKQEKHLSILQDEQQRDQFLVKMMYILLCKRLESSWKAFQITVERIRNKHQAVLDSIKLYEVAKKTTQDQESSQLSIFDQEDSETENDEDAIDLSTFEVGSKRKVRIRDIERNKRLRLFKDHLKEDIDALSRLITNLERFDKSVEKAEKTLSSGIDPDTKVAVLVKKIREKQARGTNNRNRRALIFTVYKDTAMYLFERLRDAGLGTVAMVSADETRFSDAEEVSNDFEKALERFAPYTKLYQERIWKEFQPAAELSPQDNYEEWKKYIATNHPQIQSQLANPVDILIATDVLSEGQNLQDCDFVINYDIHWNPVRAIQRMGRIDRLGSPNETIYGLNFWPSENINRYLDLQSRIEDRMAQMKLAGSEVDILFSDGIRQKAHDEHLEREQVERMLRQMETTWDDIEVGEQTFGFDDLSLEGFRQELALQLQAERGKYESMPKAVFSGCLRLPEHCPKEGIVALVAFPARPPKVREHRYQSFELLYLDLDGKPVMLNQQEILQALAHHRDEPRDLPSDLDRGEPLTIQRLTEAMQNWLKTQAGDAQEEREAQTTPSAAMDLIAALQRGENTALGQAKSGEMIQDRYQPHRYDLLAWLYVH